MTPASTARPQPRAQACQSPDSEFGHNPLCTDRAHGREARPRTRKSTRARARARSRRPTACAKNCGRPSAGGGPPSVPLNPESRNQIRQKKRGRRDALPRKPPPLCQKTPKRKQLCCIATVSSGTVVSSTQLCPSAFGGVSDLSTGFSACTFFVARPNSTISSALAGSSTKLKKANGS